ncbi:YhgE/Pip family protein [Enterococcus quebecensis]|uniref:Phage infection protein n=1 Tax=Enterococcus quebecensis TaxID=903983 RepID=A0A1E5GWJ8_9ENTE|nr:YhgE/Pip domain-containing protein [Enterococcus quebecensis]OEG16975.1 phage infection protein [Enterococcus quebecensis]OJG75342.1 YhgE/Pip domain-containing protein [Enterococcus quebecensis]
MKHIKNTLKLFKLDWQRIFKNPIATFLIIALMIIPSLYAWFNIKALWDPYANTGELPIAVYSDDKPASFKGKEVNIGDEVLKNLHENKQLGWKFVDSKQELDKGVKSGKYYAGIYLPKDFSKDLLSFTTGEITKPKIDYSINEKINAIAPKIADKGASSLQAQITDQFIQTASSTLVSVFNEIGYNLDSNLVSITKVRNMILSTDENINQIDKYTQEVVALHGKIPELKTKLGKANEFVGYLPQVDALGAKLVDLNDKMPTIKEQAKVILTLQEKIPEIQNAGKQLAMIDEDFASVEQTMNEGINEAKQGLLIIQGVQGALPEIQKLGDQADSLATATSEGAAKLQEALPGITSSMKVTLQAISTISSSVASVVEQLRNNHLTPEEREVLKQQLSDSLGRQQAVIQQLIQTMTQIQEAAGNQELQPTIAKLNTVNNMISVLKAKVDSLDVNAITDADLEAIQNTANDIAATAGSIDVDAVSTMVNNILTKLISTISTAQDLLNKAKQIDFAALLSSTEATVSNAIGILEKYQAELPAIKQEIHDANVLLNGHMDTIVNGINKGADLYNNELPVIQEKLGLAASFIQNDYPGIKENITGTLKTVNEKMPDLEAALDKANDLIQNDWPNIKSGLHKAAEAIRKGEKDVDLGEVIKLLKMDATAESDFFTKPVEIAENKIYPIANNGSASTPFYTALCLWVGAVLFSSVATTDFYLDEKDRGKYSKREQFSARMMTFLVMGLAQALIVTLGNYFLLGVDVRQPVYSVLFALLIGFSFMMMVYVLVGLFGNVGKGAAIIILVLSISGGGGNYPIQVSGKFFQFINPFLPFTHAVNLLRESAGGIYWPNAWKAIIILAMISIVFCVLGIFLYPFIEEKTKKLANVSHESRIFH